MTFDTDVPRYELEVHRKVYDNKFPDQSIYIRPDSDALGLVEVGIQNDNVHFVLMTPEQALIVAKAITSCAQEMIDASNAL